MTDEQKILLTVVIAMGIAAMIFLIYKWIRKTFYDYNEYTGRVELKSKIEEDHQKLQRAHEEYKKKQIEAQQVKKYNIDKKDPYKFRPKTSQGDCTVAVNVLRKGNLNENYAVEFYDAMNESVIRLFVDKETFDSIEVGDIGNVCYNRVSMTFYYFWSLFKK